jgi:hypothetical protein
MGDSVLWAADSYLFFTNFDLTDERADIGFGKLAIVRVSEGLRDGISELLNNLVAKLIDRRTPFPIQKRNLPLQTLNFLLCSRMWADKVPSIDNSPVPTIV